MFKNFSGSKLGKILVSFFCILGPAYLTNEANNDYGAVTTYIQSGATYGMSMLWVMALLFPIIYFCQEMSARLGICSKENFIVLIRQKFGDFWANLSLTNLLLVNFLILMTEFAGITLVSRVIGISPFITVPTSIIGFMWLVVGNKYKKWENIMIAFCTLDVLWFFMSFFTHPNYSEVIKGLLPLMPKGGISKDYLFLLMSLVGTSITYWGLTIQVSCVVEKKINIADLKMEQFETFITSIFTVLVAGAMIIVGAISYKHGLKFEDPASMALAISKWYPWLKNLILIMIINASLLGAVAVSLSSSWALSEKQGQFNKTIKDDPKFYFTYLSCIAMSGLLCLIPKLPLDLIVLGVQVLSCISLPYVLVFLHILLNDKELVGEQYINKPWQNLVNILIIIVLCALSLILLLQVLLPGLFK